MYLVSEFYNLTSAKKKQIKTQQGMDKINEKLFLTESLSQKLKIQNWKPLILKFFHTNLQRQKLRFKKVIRISQTNNLKWTHLKIIHTEQG